ncbi:MAG: efflux RND transporter periplasmic adaptor subunit, partial [Alphaproteobacteria bacterium]|nr:efflux RND transporter periplasmic adaptor subunit [Alphaproteobacteria bacterium]
MAGALACAAALAAAYLAYNWNSAASGSPVVVTAVRGDVENLVTAIGSLQPFNTVDVGAQVSGQLKKLYVKIGDDTKSGDLVAEIDSTVAAAKVDADSAQLQNFRAQLSDKQSSQILTAAQAGRQTRLKNQGATSQDAYDIALSAQRSGAAQVKAVQAQITQAQSTLDADKATLGYAKIYAPMTGTVTAIPAKEGQTLNANQQAPTILTISDLATMTVYTQVSEADVPKLRIGMDAYFTTLG